MEGDEEGEFTYIGPRGNSVIDYVLVNKQTRGGSKEVRGGGKSRI